jgi:cell division protein FtsQ
MALYQGRALRSETRTPRPPRSRVGLVVGMLVAFAALAAMTQLPWSAMRARWAVVQHIEVRGQHYLDAPRVLRTAGLTVGQDLFRVDFARARQRLLLEPRIAAVHLSHIWPRSLSVRIEERTPVLLVQHGVPWELDSAGVLLPPLAAGVEADVPLVVGPSFDRWPAGARVRTIDVDRAMAWVRAMSDRDLQLGGQLSEVDVSDAQNTGLTLMSGTRVLSLSWPPDRRKLSALRVVLADLKQRGIQAREVDMRFEDQIVVRPIVSAPIAGAGSS